MSTMTRSRPNAIMDPWIPGPPLSPLAPASRRGEPSVAPLFPAGPGFWERRSQLLRALLTKRTGRSSHNPDILKAFRFAPLPIVGAPGRAPQAHQPRTPPRSTLSTSGNPGFRQPGSHSNAFRSAASSLHRWVHGFLAGAPGSAQRTPGGAAWACRPPARGPLRGTRGTQIPPISTGGRAAPVGEQPGLTGKKPTIGEGKRCDFRHQSPGLGPGRARSPHPSTNRDGNRNDALPLPTTKRTETDSRKRKFKKNLRPVLLAISSAPGRAPQAHRPRTVPRSDRSTACLTKRTHSPRSASGIIAAEAPDETNPFRARPSFFNPFSANDFRYAVRPCPQRTERAPNGRTAL